MSAFAFALSNCQTVNGPGLSDRSTATTTTAARSEVTVTIWTSVRRRVLRSWFARGPDLLGRPLARPLRAHVAVVVVFLRVRARVHVDKALDLQAIRVQEIDPTAVGQVVLDADLLGPLGAVEPGERTLKRLADITHVGRTHHRNIRIGHEHEASARPQQARGLWDPELWIGPERRTVLGEREIERCVRQRDALGRRFDERERDPALLLHPPRGREPGRCRIHSDRPRTALRQPRGEIRGPTPEFDHVAIAHLTKRRAELLFADPEEPPRH